MRARFASPRVWAALSAATIISSSAWAGEAGRSVNEALNFLMGAAIVVLVLVALAITKAGVVAFNLCANELLPRLFQSGRAVLTASPVKSFFVGLVNIILAWIIGVALLRTKVAALLGVLLLIALWLVMMVSRTIVYQLLGRRVTGEVSDPDAAPGPRALCLGGLTVELAFLAPIIGQIAMLVVTVMTTGALVLAAMRRERPSG